MKTTKRIPANFFRHFRPIASHLLSQTYDAAYLFKTDSKSYRERRRRRSAQAKILSRVLAKQPYLESLRSRLSSFSECTLARWVDTYGYYPFDNPFWQCKEVYLCPSCWVRRHATNAFRVWEDAWKAGDHQMDWWAFQSHELLQYGKKIEPKQIQEAVRSHKLTWKFLRRSKVANFWNWQIEFNGLAWELVTRGMFSGKLEDLMNYQAQTPSPRFQSSLHDLTLEKSVQTTVKKNFHRLSEAWRSPEYFQSDCFQESPDIVLWNCWANSVILPNIQHCRLKVIHGKKTARSEHTDGTHCFAETTDEAQ